MQYDFVLVAAKYGQLTQCPRIVLCFGQMAGLGRLNVTNDAGLFVPKNNHIGWGLF